MEPISTISTIYATFKSLQRQFFQQNVTIYNSFVSSFAIFRVFIFQRTFLQRTLTQGRSHYPCGAAGGEGENGIAKARVCTWRREKKAKIKLQLSPSMQQLKEESESSKHKKSAQDTIAACN